MLTVILLLIATGCFLAAALGAAVPRINLVAAGLFFWVLTVLIAAWP